MAGMQQDWEKEDVLMAVTHKDAVMHYMYRQSGSM